MAHQDKMAETLALPLALRLGSVEKLRSLFVGTQFPLHPPP